MVAVLAGTRDERTFHLQAISALAQIIHDKNFLKQWLNAKDVNALKDVVFLGKRQRHP